MRKLLLLAAWTLLLTETTQAQRQCGAQIVRDIAIARDPANALKLQHRAQHLRAQAEAYSESIQELKLKTTSVQTIPVIFHIVLTSNQIANLGGVSGIQQRVMSQLQVLNEDFSKSNADTARIPAVFKPLAANTNIQFGLAHRKPDGSSTPGYEIITTTVPSFGTTSDMKHSSSGGADGWDPGRYLNIWVVSLGNSILGFTVPPSLLGMGYTRTDLGVVLNYLAFGRKPAATPLFLTNFDLGRTLTHEVGHYFELEHIWGDDGGLCPTNGGNDDGVADTPPQASESTGKPTFPKFDACTPSGTGVMFMNYMDYSDDTSLFMFTKGQADRMNSHLVTGGESDSLTLFPEILEWPTSIGGLALENSVQIYPNPSEGTFTVQAGKEKELRRIDIFDISGRLVYSRVADPAARTGYSIELTEVPKGIYLVRCIFAEGTVARKITIQ